MPPLELSEPGRTWPTATLRAPDVANNTYSTPCEIRPALRKPPIDSLPEGLVGEIFILALPSDYELFERLQMSMPPDDKPKFINPLLFCAVCSLRRSIALSTTQLWKRAFIFVSQGMKKDQAEQKAAYLVRWIERSGSLPLTLHISSSGSVSQFVTGPNTPIISALNRYAARRETLYYHSAQDHESPLSMLPLSHLSFGFASWHSLRQIRSSHMLHEPDQTIPWAQLTDLQIHAYMPLRATTIFRDCPQLVRLSIAVQSIFQGVHLSPIIQHGLVTLSLTTDDCSVVVPSISLPNLRNLHLSKLTATQLESLLDFFTRSSCNLDKLVISETYLMQQDYLNLLAHKSCELLSSLTINKTLLSHQPSVEEELVRRLTLHQHDSLCIHLKVLTMTCLIKASTSALLNMVKSRIGSHDDQVPDGPLQYLELLVVSDQIQKLEEVGTRSGVKYTCQMHDYLDYGFSILLRRRYFRERIPVAKFNGTLFDEM